MKAKEIFNFKRFGKYFGSDIKTCWANFGLSLLTISVLFPVVVYIITSAFYVILTNEWSGPGSELRLGIFAVAMICIVVTMPVKCYGKITDKQYGSFWLTLPASRLEKFLSMVILTCILVPLAGAAMSLGIDAVICGLDHTCGSSIAAEGLDIICNLGEKREVTLNLMYESLEIKDAAVAQNIIQQMSSPWLYIDEFFGITLPFLLGAIFFRKGKTVKTFLALFAFSSLMSIVLTPLMVSWSKEIISAFENVTDEAFILSVFDNGFFRNLVLIDTISDLLFNGVLLTGIWFRIKTLKH